MAENNKKLVEGLEQAWRMEVAGARTYRELASRERDSEKRRILTRMAEAEERHAAKWESRLKDMGQNPPRFNERPGERFRRWLLVESGTDSAVHTIENAEDFSDSLYQELLGEATEEQDKAALKEVQLEEKAHGKMLGEMSQPSKPEGRLERIMQGEKWHVRGGGWIGQAIYGVNDGLGAAFGVVSGVAGATAVNSEFVLLSGLAAAIASALSMGSGAYLATKSQREVYEAELGRERREIELDPAEEQEEMELYYELKGFKTDEAKMLAARLAEQPEQLLKSLAHEELGLSEASFPDPFREAISASIATAVGAIIPVLPFFFLSGVNALITSFVISTIAHFAVGASKVIVTGRSWVKSGAEMTVVGLGEATITYIIGLLISPAIKV